MTWRRFNDNPDTYDEQRYVQPKRTTHYVDADVYVDRFGNTRAVCGAHVNELNGETVHHNPTCAQCIDWLRRRDEEPLPSWAIQDAEKQGRAS